MFEVHRGYKTQYHSKAYITHVSPTCSFHGLEAQCEMDMHVEAVVPARGDNIFKSEKLLVSKKVSLVAKNS